MKQITSSGKSTRVIGGTKEAHRIYAKESVTAVLIYSGNHYGVFDLDDYTIRVTGMEDTPRDRLNALMRAQKEDRLKRNQ